MVCVYALSNSVASHAEFLCYSLRQWPGYAEPGDGYDATSIHNFITERYKSESLADLQCHVGRKLHFAASIFLAEKDVFLWL